MQAKNKPTTTDRHFKSPQGHTLVARPTGNGEQSGGWYGGVSLSMYERNGFSCGARYYYGADIENELGQLINTNTESKTS